MRIKEFLICHDNIAICKLLFSFGYFWCGARYLIASYIATENECLVVVILASKLAIFGVELYIS